MRKQCAPGAAIVLLLATAGSAWAVDNSPGTSQQCMCLCHTPAGTDVANTYAMPGSGCGGLDNRTCNVENPQTHLIETGSIIGCAAVASGGAGSQAESLQDPGTGPALPPRLTVQPLTTVPVLRQ
jgi:hypothetical protein